GLCHRRLAICPQSGRARLVIFRYTLAARSRIVRAPVVVGRVDADDAAETFSITMDHRYGTVNAGDDSRWYVNGPTLVRQARRTYRRLLWCPQRIVGNFAAPYGVAGCDAPDVLMHMMF